MWWSREPYISNSNLPNRNAQGLFYDIMQLLIKDICRNCSEILFESPSNGSIVVEKAVENDKPTTDFGFPLYGSKEQEKFRGFPFIPIGKWYLKVDFYLSVWQCEQEQN